MHEMSKAYSGKSKKNNGVICRISQEVVELIFKKLNLNISRQNFQIFFLTLLISG